MKTSRILLGALILCALPAFTQPEAKPINGLSYPLVTPEEAARLVQRDNPIALHLRNVTLQAAFSELTKQTGIKLDTSWGGGDKKTLAQKLSLDIETHSFHEAFRAIVDAANVKAQLQRIDPGNVLNVVFGDQQTDNDLPIAGKAPFQIRVRSLDLWSSRGVTLGETPIYNQDSNLSISLMTDIDPLIPTLGGESIHITKAEDEQGRAIQEHEAPVQLITNSNAWEIGMRNFRFKAPEVGSQKLAHLDGVMICVLPTKYEIWSIGNVLTTQNATHEFKSEGQTVRVTITSVHQQGNNLGLVMKVFVPSAGAENGRPHLLSNAQLLRSIRLVDAKGRELKHGSYNLSGNNTEAILQENFYFPIPTLQFTGGNSKVQPRPLPETPNLTEPVAFTLHTPVECIQTEVPFSFSNLPLP